MNTEQLKQAAMAATPGEWIAGSRTVIARESDERSAMDLRLFGGNGKDHAANARYIAAARPATILALLECVDALRLYKNWCDAEKDHGGTSFWDRVEMCREAESATDAALQKLEAL